MVSGQEGVCLPGDWGVLEDVATVGSRCVSEGRTLGTDEVGTPLEGTVWLGLSGQES